MAPVRGPVSQRPHPDEQFQQIVGAADQIPLALGRGQAATVKPVESTNALDLAEDRLDRLRSFLVLFTAGRQPVLLPARSPLGAGQRRPNNQAMLAYPLITHRFCGGAERT